MIRRLRALLIAAHRFGRHRARTADDKRFAAVLIDGIHATLHAVGAPAPDKDSVNA